MTRRFVGGLEMSPPLTLEEERRLYPIIVRGRAAAESLESSEEYDSATRRRLSRARHAGQEAESALLRATCGLVRARVQERGYRFGNEELEAAGVEGLVNALQRFDPSRGVRFATYANYWIMKLVNQAVQQQAGLTDTEMRRVLALQKLERASDGRPLEREFVAQSLGISTAAADEVLHVSRELQARRYESPPLPDLAAPSEVPDIADAPSWVIDELRRRCGDDFDAFWQYTFRVMSMDEIARSKGITRQGMAKRIERCRRAVRESPEADRLLAWFDHQ